MLIILLSAFMSCSNYRYETKHYNAVYRFSEFETDIENNFSYQIIDTLKNGLILSKQFSKDSILISSFFRNPKNKIVGELKKWYQNGKLKEVKNYSDSGGLFGEYKYYYENGIIKQNLNFINAKLNGIVKTYFENGNIRRLDYYTNDRLDSGTCWNSQGNIVKHTDFEKKPDLNMKLFSNNLIYPENLRISNIEERVIIKVYIGANGVPINFKYDNNHSKEFISEIARVVNIPNIFKPAFHEDVPFDCIVDMPVNFRLISK